MERKDFFALIESTVPEKAQEIIAAAKSTYQPLDNESAGYRTRLKDYETVEQERNRFKAEIEALKQQDATGGKESLEVQKLRTVIEDLQTKFTAIETQKAELEKKNRLGSIESAVLQAAGDKYPVDAKFIAKLAVSQGLVDLDESGAAVWKLPDGVYPIDQIDRIEPVLGLSKRVMAPDGTKPPQGNRNASSKFENMNLTQLMQYSKQSPAHAQEVLDFNSSQKG